jgi:molecular chaperone HscB
MTGLGTAMSETHSTDYFAIFALPRKLWIDMSTLEQKFLQMSWKLHPDNFVNASEAERASSLRRSSELNDAYRTLKEPVARVEYLLAIEGARKEGEQKQQVPPELLEEVFELNESLDELREAKAEGGDLAAMRQRLESARKNFQQKLQEVDAELFKVAQEWDATVDAEAGGTTAQPGREAVKRSLNELLNRRAYIRNLVHNVQKELL